VRVVAAQNAAVAKLQAALEVGEVAAVEEVCVSLACDSGFKHELRILFGRLQNLLIPCFVQVDNVFVLLCLIIFDLSQAPALCVFLHNGLVLHHYLISLLSVCSLFALCSLSLSPPFPIPHLTRPSPPPPPSRATRF
jgi:hypothetical protein